MGWKHLVSRDPRKGAVVAAMKKKSGGTKITLVQESTTDDCFRGNALRPSGRGAHRTLWTDVGQVIVTKDEVEGLS